MNKFACACLCFSMLILTSCQSSEPTVKHGTFEARHEIVMDVPENAGTLRAWLAIPSGTDPDQEVMNLKISSPHTTRTVQDELGNQFLYVEANRPKAGALEITTEFEIERREVRRNVDPNQTRPHTAQELREFAADLQDSSQSRMTPEVRKMAADAVGSERNPIRVARLLYDAILDHVEYHVKDPLPNAEKQMNSSGTGSSQYTFEKCTGNCTDFHSLYAALARSRNIPTRAVYGSFFKGPLNGKDKDQSYHCWIEFHAPNVGWIPLDVAVADVFVDEFQANEHSRPRAHLTVADGYYGPNPDLVEYYFGNLDERRVVWHRGRDLVMRNPRQAGDPLLWNPKAYAEVDGKAIKVQRKLTYVSKP